MCRAFWIRGLLLLLGVCELASCNPHHFTNPQPMGGLPQKIGQGKEIGKVVRDRWWQLFKDPVLDRLMETGLEENFDVKKAYQALKAQYALYKVERGRYFPKITGNYSISRSRRPGFFGKDLGTDYSFGASLDYELDIWKSIQAGVKAQDFESKASWFEIESLKLLVSSEIAKEYFTIKDLMVQLRLLDEKQKALEKRLDLVFLRYEEGLVTSQDIYKEEMAISNVKETRLELKRELDSARNRLSLLLGRYPGGDELITTPGIVKIPPLDQGFVPVSVLLKRPDIKAKEAKVRAQDWRVAQSIADWFPRIGLSLGYGRSRSASSFGIISGIFWNIALNAGLSLFEGGAGVARVEREKAALLSALLDYQLSVLKAINEVKDALTFNESSEERFDEAVYRSRKAQAIYELSRSRYELGISDALKKIDSKIDLLDAKMKEKTSLKNLAMARIDLVKALGGSWRME